MADGHSGRFGRGRRGAFGVAAVAILGATTLAATPGSAAAQGSSSLGTATATAGAVNLDLRLLGGVLGPLHLGGAGGGLDVPLSGLVLGQASAPTADGDAANFTNSTLRLRDGLISTLHLSGDSADLIKADAASGTARVVEGPGAYAQAYATVANLRLFLPLVTLPGADASNGFLKIDAVSAQATCVPGQKPSASAKTPATILLLGHQIPVPLNGDVPLDLGVAKVDVHLSPVTTSDTAGAAASVEARISVDAAGLVSAGGAIVLASATCTSPVLPAAASAPGGSTSSAPGGTTGGTSGAQGTSAQAGGGQSVAGGANQGSNAGAANQGSTAQDATGQVAADQGADQGVLGQAPTSALAAGPAADAAGQGPMADTGASGDLLPAMGAALAALIGGFYLVRFYRRRRAASDPPVRGFRPRG